MWWLHIQRPNDRLCDRIRNYCLKKEKLVTLHMSIQMSLKVTGSPKANIVFWHIEWHGMSMAHVRRARHWTIKSGYCPLHQAWMIRCLSCLKWGVCAEPKRITPTQVTTCLPCCHLPSNTEVSNGVPPGYEATSFLRLWDSSIMNLSIYKIVFLCVKALQLRIIIYNMISII